MRRGSILPPSRTGAWHPEINAAALSDDEPVAEIQLIQIKKSAVPIPPGPVLDVRCKSTQPLIAFVLRHYGERRDSRPYLRVQVGFGPPPECAVESVDAVVWDQDGEDLALSQLRDDV